MKYTTDRIPRAPSSTCTPHAAHVTRHLSIHYTAAPVSTLEDALVGRLSQVCPSGTLYHMYGVDVVCARGLNVALN